MFTKCNYKCNIIYINSSFVGNTVFNGVSGYHLSKISDQPWHRFNDASGTCL